MPEVESQPFDVHEVIDGLVDDDSFFEIKPLFAPELVVGFGRMDGPDRRPGRQQLGG